MQDHNPKQKIYKISYKDEHGEEQVDLFLDSPERAKNRLEKFKQGHENYTEIELKMLPSSPNAIFEPL